MAEELKNLENNEDLNEEGQEELEGTEDTKGSEPQFSEVEAKAMKMGWKPKDVFDDSDDYVDAEEFIKRKPLFDRNTHLKNELKDVKKALRELATFQMRIREDERKKAYADLRAEKLKAFEEGDAAKVIDIDDKIADVRAEEIAQKNAPKVQQQIHPNFVAWVDQNSWYVQDSELRAEADFLGTRYAASNPDKDPDEVLRYVASKIKRSYPERFENPNRNKPSLVEGTSKGSSKSVKKNDISLTEDETKAMKTFVRQGIMTEDEYKAEIKKLKGVA